LRIRTYGLPLPEDVQAYVARVVSLPSVSRWMQEALAEKDFIASQEPYRSAPQ
jgi:glutathione S-transferase